MSVSAGVAAAAAAQSAAAAAAANAARVTACMKFVQGYAHDTASVSQMREYAGCIDTLYPSAMDADSALALKVAIVVVFVCLVIGAVRGFDSYSYSSASFSDRVMGAVVWAGGSACVLLAAALVYTGVMYVAS